MTTPLTSKWTGLNSSLLATVYPVDTDGQPLPDGARVIAPVTDGNIEITANWQSPFEGASADARAPALTGMLQAGHLDSVVQAVGGTGRDAGDTFFARLRQEFAERVSQVSEAAAGRSGVTKLNSTQVFAGAAPIKLPVTLLFRAFDSPGTEVTAPIDQLARWTLPRKLAATGAIISAIQALRDSQGVLKAMLPSETPQLVGFRYGGRTFAPLVIESMGMPITVPRSSAGEPLHVSVQLVLASMAALDAADWTRAGQFNPIDLYVR